VEATAIQRQLVLRKRLPFATLPAGEAPPIPAPVPERPWPDTPPAPDPSLAWTKQGSSMQRAILEEDASLVHDSGLAFQQGPRDLFAVYLQLDDDHLVGLTPRKSILYTRAP